MLAALIFFALPSTVAADDGCTPELCEGGRCFEERGVPYCLCGPGLAADGLGCVPAADDRLVRSTQAVELGERAVQIAMDQYGRDLAHIGRGWNAPPYELASHVRPNEWWCTDFVAWVYAAAGIPFTGGADGGWLVSGNDAAQEWFRERTVFVDRTHPDWDTFVPRAGDYVRFETPRSGHSAIVRYVEGDRLYTVEGNVDGKVWVDRHDEYRSIRQLVGFGVPMLENDEPHVAAIADPVVVMPAAATFDAELADDGPVDRLRVAWRLVGGPGQALFDDPTSARTTATFTAPGVYRFAIEVDDGDLFAASEVVVDVTSPVEPPIAEEAMSCSAASDGPTALALVALAAFAGALRRSRRSA
jgi:uncharacterized protein (TIGR03382 family)